MGVFVLVNVTTSLIECVSPSWFLFVTVVVLITEIKNNNYLNINLSLIIILGVVSLNGEGAFVW